MQTSFQGWKKKINLKSFDSQGGYCAWGYLFQKDSKSEVSIPRIGGYIQKNLNPPSIYIHPLGDYPMHPQKEPGDAIVWANNTDQLDILGFIRIDLLSQGYTVEQAEEFIENYKIEQEIPN